MLVIDEISYISPEALGQIDNRLRQLMGKPESPFGGLAVLLMGDFYQLPPVAEPYNLYSATMKLLVDRKEIENGDPGPRTRGAFFSANLENLSFFNK